MIRLIINDIIRQTNVLFLNIEKVFKLVDDILLQRKIMNRQLWRQIYHLLHSFDQWFINPSEFIDPDFHEEQLNYYDSKSTKTLSKKELISYYESINLKISNYLNSLDDHQLHEKPKNCIFSRIELILAQNRHFMYNIGIIHSLILHETGDSQPYIGMSVFEK